MSTPDPAFTAARERLGLLQAQLQRGQATPVRLVETHISWVLLAADEAYKLKKPLRLPFLDFSTLAARRACCEEELRLNRRLAPQIYLGLAEVRAGAQGAAFGGDGELLDVAVHMRRFGDGALWRDQLAAGTLRAEHVEAMARQLAAFQRGAAVAPPDSPFGGPAVQQHTTEGLVEAMDRWHATAASSQAPPIDWPGLRQWLLAEQARLAPHAQARLRDGFVREGHGDLHLANLLLLDGEPCAFDGIDFDPALRWIDVLDDIAFTVMDLLAHGAPALAWRFLDAWLAETGDHAGLPALRLQLVRRALVRARVMDMSAAATPIAGPGADDYRRLAAQLAQAADARLAITHGLPGSGKSHAALQLVAQAGALRLRSDVERKRLAGLAPLEASAERAPGLYGTAATAATYGRLLELARGVLEAGWPVVVDAAFLRREERAAFAALAGEAGCPFAIVDCRAAPAVLHARIAARQARGGDPSEADAAVLEHLSRVAEPLGAAEQAAALVVDAADPTTLETLPARWGAAQPWRTRFSS
jgi:aminoglycoside phosphotransferase family enzyme/predicted kinase